MSTPHTDDGDRSSPQSAATDSPVSSSPSPQRDAPSHVVGVGASAGGLEALEQLFGAMPEDTGMAFVVIQHLSPDFKSVMDELLARRTKIPVLLVTDGMRVQPNRIYLIPPKKEMIIAGGRLLLSDKGTSQELTLPIDIFFRSLAQDVGLEAIGIVLSGAGSDGARGMRDIHDAGGLTLCQDEESANFDGMPRSARDTGIVDHVLPPSQMPKLLVEHARRAESPVGVLTSPARPSGVAAVFRFLQDANGIDFSHYKPATVLRRIERRLQLNHSASLEAYIDRLAGDPTELDALFHDLLIGVTRFFRDEEAFARLEQVVIPELLERTSPTEELRIWVAGCATGEEAYSIAILLQEQMLKQGERERRRVRILATDVHRGSLEVAGRGLYDEARVAHMKPALLERYFDKQGQCYQISPELRQIVVFAPHNVVKDAPFTRLDLISCRNMLIYLQPLAQKKVLNLFHFALKRQGVLFLGPSENIGALSDDFATLDTHWRLYRKNRDVRLPNDFRVASPRPPILQGAHGDPHAIAANYTLSQAIGVYDALLDQHMPPSLLVNERRELVHAFGGAGRFLKIKDGRPSRDIWDMLGPDLKVAVTGAMQRALKEHTAVTYHGLNLSVGDEAERPHKLSVRPVVAPGASLNHLLVTIEQVDLPPRPSPLEAEVDFSQISRDELRSLEAELRRTKESLQATIEELETSNEELQAANEELLASNEELQSTNEELQSVNEELYTVNSEYQRKIAELTQLTNDMDNLLASIEVGTIFLDQQLCIRKFTPLVAEAFNLLPQDIGRPIAGFSTSLNHPRLLEDLVEVLRSERPIEREVCDRMGKWFFLRILPYKARGSARGVVLTLIDINSLKAAEDAVFHERYLLNSLMDSVPDSIYFKDTAGRFVRINNATASRLGLESPAEAVGKAAADILSDEVGRTFDHLDARALAGEVQPYEQEQVQNQDGRVSWFMTTRQPLLDRESKVVGMFGVARDVTDQKRAEDEIRLAVTRRDQFLAMLSHELRNPLAAIVNAAMLLHQEGIAVKPSSKGLNVIQRQSRQMTRLLDDLLEVSRITQNKIELRRQVIDARSVASEAAAATRDKFSKRRVDLTLELDEEPVMVDADPARLQQVLVNLLDNASKYNRAGGRAALFLRRDGGHAALRVWDDGAGIDPGSLGTIFEPFVQVRATLDRTDGGMGVGLTLVRSLVAMHGGTVEARSDGLGRGSEFVAKLPLVMAQVEGPAAARQRVRWPTGKRVVVIEDNEDSCQTLQLLLESAGYEVFTAGDGKSGLALIERVQPDTALVDIGLPVMDGFELARRVRAQEKYRNLFLVALTGYGQAADQIAAVEAGFDEHVVKPMDPEELTRLMRGGGRGGDA